jgi:Pro-kumamolisin, activation domain/Bacterial Ig-like domain (group 3)
MRSILAGRIRVHRVISSVLLRSFLLTLSFSANSAAQGGAQTGASRPLIVQAVDESELTTLKGNTHPLARPEFDLGTAPATLPMERMLLVLKRPPERQAALKKLLDDQQDKRSPNYHRWLTPEEFGKQFGPSDSDMQTISGWLQSHGFQVGSTKGRTVLEFSGSASQVQEAFHTPIHRYAARDELHWANASDPQIPTALTPAVAGVLTLHNFIKKPALHFSGERVAAKLVAGKKKPQVTFPPQNGQPAVHALAPQDYATIYNINPLYNYYINPMYSGINGYGIAIAVVGRSNLYSSSQNIFFQPTDIMDFGSVFNLGLGPYFNVYVNGPDPGDLGGGEEAEATLDSTWSAAIAPGAGVTLVVSATTNTTDGIDLSEAYIIESNSADVMTESFSSCELDATDADLAGHEALAEQAAAQGISYMVSTGDDGAEGCDDPSVAPATSRISVNFLASTAYTTAVGGTMFNENGDPSKYWASTAPISETALSYIPENVWNESSTTNGLWSSSGGASAGNIAAGGTTAGVPKPYWQYGVTGIPNDNVRDLPDVSLTAASHDPYLLCLEGSCEPNAQGEFYVYFVGGTSAAAPSFAGIMALVDQMSESVDPGVATFVRQGLPNYILYRLAAMESSYPAQCNGSNTSTSPASNCIFHDVTIGNNVVPGEVGSDYQAGVGYDLATGLGSVNVTNLANQWNSVTFNPTTTTLSLNGGTAVNITHGQSVPVSITVAPSSGTGTAPTGDVSLVLYQSDECCNGFQTGALGLWPLSSGSVSTSTNALPGGVYYLLAAQYAGDENYAPSTSSTTGVTVSAEPSTTAVSVLTPKAAGNFVPFTSGPFGSFVYLRADVAGQSGYGVPTGTVTFNDTFGPVPGGGAYSLNGQGNTATPNGILSFDAGTHTISASYGGDPSFNASSTTVSQTFTITPGFLASIASSSSTVVVSSPGGSGQTSVMVQYSTGFNGTINLACAGAPSEATCTISPSSVKTTGIAGSTTATVSITTQAATTSALYRRQTKYLLAQWLGAGLIFSFVLTRGKQRRLPGIFLLLILALVVVGPSCGGGGGGSSTPPPPPPNPGTPTGSYNMTVTATSGSMVSQTAFALVVQ